ncbi:hypothetical protein [Providencia rettgeri]|uniref:hypothetical protein n=1 Tax=Providencia rettgeri TaxID=587 RepID=UPI000BC5BDA2|nr:hypothetical protein CQA26_02350 [Providencia rettgeri]BBU96730.1 hypothetical protein BML2496_26130 [Providencia rettgeri]
MDIFSWINRIDWGLAIALISLFFTAFVSFITIRYTKKSLNYTKESMQVAKESLLAAQKSIKISIELHEQERNIQLTDLANSNSEKRRKAGLLSKYPLLVIHEHLLSAKKLLTEIKKISSNEKINKIDMTNNDSHIQFCVQFNEVNESYFYLYNSQYYVNLFTDIYNENSVVIDEFTLGKCGYLSHSVGFSLNDSLNYLVFLCKSQNEEFKIVQLTGENSLYLLKSIENTINLTAEVYKLMTKEEIS